MKIADAKPGDVLRDRDGDVWVRSARRALLVYSDGDGEGETAAPMDPEQADRVWGPFVRLVPEVLP